MTDSGNPVPKCPRCGARVASDAPDGLCPRCLIALNLVTETEIPGEEGSPGTREVKPPVPPAPSPEALVAGGVWYDWPGRQSELMLMRAFGRLV
jgi:hypothetical protein